MKLNLTKQIYTCEKCKSEFTEFKLSGNTYGEFILFNRQSDKLYWNTLSDNKVFDELNNLFDELPQMSQLKYWERDEIFQSILGICCDKKQDDSLFRTKPYCPICGSSSVIHHGQPPVREVREFEVNVATHQLWNNLTENQKKEQIAKTIAELNSS